MALRIIPKLKLTLLDGKEYSFLASAGGIERAMELKKVSTTLELFSSLEMIKDGIPLLWDSMLDKPDGATLEWFKNNVPADVQGIGESVNDLFGVSMPKPSEGNPTGGAPETTEAPPATQ